MRKIIGFLLLGFIAGLYFSLFLFQPLWENSIVVGIILVTIGILAFSLSFFNDEKIVRISIFVALIVGFSMLFLGEAHNDYYRYLWDGWLSVKGISPYSVFPLQVSQELQNVWYWNLLDFKLYYTSYGTASQIIFAIASWIKPGSLFVLRIVMSILSLGTGYLLYDLLKGDDLGRKYLPFVFLSPVFLFSVIAGVHTEIILSFFMILSLWLYKKKKFGFLGVSLSAMVFTKFYPILIIPFFLQHKNWKKVASSFVLTSVLLILPLTLNGGFYNLIDAVQKYANDWVVSPGIRYVLSWVVSFFSINSYEMVASVVTIVAVLLMIIYLLKKQVGIEKGVFFTFAIFIFLSSAVFSWYWLPLLLLLPFVSKKIGAFVVWTIIFFPLQYALIIPNDINNTFVYLKNGLVPWFQIIVWIPAILILIYFMIFKRENVENKDVAVVFYSKFHKGNLFSKTRLGRDLYDQKLIESNDKALMCADEFGKLLIYNAFQQYLPKINDSYDFYWFHGGSYDIGRFKGDSRVKEMISGKFNNVGEGMKYLQEQMFAKGYKKVIIVGSDVPLFTKSMLLKAIFMLDEVDVVVSPVIDKGYAMIGTSGLIDLFSEIENFESRSIGYNLMSETENLAKQKNKIIYKLDMLFDIDCIYDVRVLYNKITEQGKLKNEYKFLKRLYKFLKKHKKAFGL